MHIARLSGDIGTLNASSDNSYHILRIDPFSTNSLIDGFTIENGNAAVTASIDQMGAGILCEGKATLKNVIFENHLATSDGAVILNMGVSAKLTLLDCEVKYDFTAPQNYILNSTNAELIIQSISTMQKD